MTTSKLADLHAAEQLTWEAVSGAKDHAAKCYREEHAARLKSRLASERVETLEIEAEAAMLAREAAEITMARKEGARAKA